MGDDKKDILEFPLETIEVPQAIALMMQAASATREAIMVVDNEVTLRTDDDRLQLLCEKLEARIEDAIDEGKSVMLEENVVDAPDEEPVVDTDIFVMEDGDILNYRGVLYMKMCNMVVLREEDRNTFCCKQWEHESPEHEDKEGNVRH